MKVTNFCGQEVGEHERARAPAAVDASLFTAHHKGGADVLTEGKGPSVYEINLSDRKSIMSK